MSCGALDVFKLNFYDCLKRAFVCGRAHPLTTLHLCPTCVALLLDLCEGPMAMLTLDEDCVSVVLPPSAADSPEITRPLEKLRFPNRRLSVEEDEETWGMTPHGDMREFQFEVCHLSATCWHALSYVCTVVYKVPTWLERCWCCAVWCCELIPPGPERCGTCGQRNILFTPFAEVQKKRLQL